LSFPTFKNTPQFQQGGGRSYYAPNVPEQQNATGVMSYEGTIRRGLGSFALLLVTAAAGWFVPGLAIPAVLAGLVLGLVIAFKRISNPVATLSYTALQGLVVGGFSSILEAIYPGVVSQAVLATLCVFATILFFFSNGTFRTTPRLNKIFMVAGVSYLIFSLANLGLVMFGVSDSMFGLYGDLGIFGIAIGILGTLLAAYSLVIDFEFVKNGVDNQIDSKWEWLAVFSLIGTLVWLYIEILRLISLFRS
jgi:uncharacterized YccA/Bax inhibitor family protein